MVLYRRMLVPGGSYFFTLTLRNRRLTWLTSHVDLLRASFREVRAARPFQIDAIVVLPDHLHAVWTLPDGDADYANRWRLIKGGFTQRLKARGITLEADHRGEHGVWGRRFWEHWIRDERDRRQHVDYIHYNPVKHGYVSAPGEWAHSSFRRYVRQGLLPPDWGASGLQLPRGVGRE